MVNGLFGNWIGPQCTLMVYKIFCTPETFSIYWRLFITGQNGLVILFQNVYFAGKGK